MTATRNLYRVNTVVFGVVQFCGRDRTQEMEGRPHGLPSPSTPTNYAARLDLYLEAAWKDSLASLAAWLISSASCVSFSPACFSSFKVSSSRETCSDWPRSSANVRAVP